MDLNNCGNQIATAVDITFNGHMADIPDLCDATSANDSSSDLDGGNRLHHEDLEPTSPLGRHHTNRSTRSKHDNREICWHHCCIERHNEQLTPTPRPRRANWMCKPRRSAIPSLSSPLEPVWGVATWLTKPISRITRKARPRCSCSPPTTTRMEGLPTTSHIYPPERHLRRPKELDPVVASI